MQNSDFDLPQNNNALWKNQLNKSHYSRFDLKPGRREDKKMQMLTSNFTPFISIFEKFLKDPGYLNVQIHTD